MTVDQGTHLEAVDDGLSRFRLRLTRTIELVDLFARCFQLGLAPDAFLQEVALVLVILQLIFGALSYWSAVMSEFPLLHQLLVAREGALEVAIFGPHRAIDPSARDSPVVSVNSSCALIEGVLEQACSRLDVLFLRAGIGEAPG